MNKNIGSELSDLRGTKGKSSSNKLESSKSVCNLCRKKFRSRYHLKLHLAVHTGEKNYECALCKKGYQQKWNLVTHVARVHSKEKPFECRDCGKSFGYSSHFKRHVKNHFLEKIKASEEMKKKILNPHGCRFCEKSFDSNYRLDVHTRTHTGNRPFMCDKCGKRFISKGVYATHFKKKHNDVSWLQKDKKNNIKSVGEEINFQTAPKKELLAPELREKYVTKIALKRNLNVHNVNNICSYRFFKKEFSKGGSRLMQEDNWEENFVQKQNNLTAFPKPSTVSRPNDESRNSSPKEFAKVFQNKQPAENARERKTENLEKLSSTMGISESGSKPKCTGNETIEEFLKIASSWVNKKFNDSKQFGKEDERFLKESNVEVCQRREKAQKAPRDSLTGNPKSVVLKNFKASFSNGIKKKINNTIFDKIVESLRTSSAKDKVLEVAQKIKQKRDADVLKEFLREMAPVPDNEIMVSNEGRVFWRCWLCESKLRSRHLLARHLIIHEPEKNRPFKCEICPKTFTQTNNLKEHAMTHNNENQFLCEKCGKGFRHKSHFNAHVRGHGTPFFGTSPKKHECAYCGKKVHTNHQRIEHERTHTRERPYLCKICGLQFGASSTLTRHLSVHEPAKHQCLICLKFFKQKASLKRHHGTHSKDLICPTNSELPNVNSFLK